MWGGDARIGALVGGGSPGIPSPYSVHARRAGLASLGPCGLTVLCIAVPLLLRPCRAAFSYTQVGGGKPGVGLEGLHFTRWLSCGATVMLCRQRGTVCTAGRGA